MEPRHANSFDQYRRLYPSLPDRVSAILQSENPFVTERLQVLARLAAHKSTERILWFSRKFKLTPMESQIAVFLAEGGTVQGYARKFGKSPATVRTHLKAIFRKTGASRQADLPALMVRRGLL